MGATGHLLLPVTTGRGRTQNRITLTQVQATLATSFVERGKAAQCVDQSTMKTGKLKTILASVNTDCLFLSPVGMF